MAAVPWARHGAGHTRGLDEQVAWLATQCSKTAITQVMRIAWRTVGAIITRVWADIDAAQDRFAGLRRLGIDEISSKRHHKYLTVVVDHDWGRLVWAKPGRDNRQRRHWATLASFFDQLGPERSALITQVSADGAEWISTVVAKQCPQAVRCADPFHVVQWATEAVDEVRRQAWNLARGAVTRRRVGRSTGHASRRGHSSPGGTVDRSRQSAERSPACVVEEPGEPDRPAAGEAGLDRHDQPRLHRAYQLKEGLRLVFSLDPAEAPAALDRWIGWARRCRIEAFVQLQRRIVKHRASILAAIEHGLSNGRIESVNTKTRLLTRIAFGFNSPDALIALAMLTLGGHPPVLPGRA